MCGFTGFLRFGNGDPGSRRALLARMTGRLAHRGPDADGHWLDSEGGIALGHRRLSIIDLSEAGAQPMASPAGRYVIAYNGEIYNHRDLRDTLASAGLAPPWRGHSDTETLLAGFEAWGIEATLKRAIGMFAFAVWDRAERALLLGRDRLGEKPLYYGWQGNGPDRAFLFGSELAALTAHPAMTAAIDPDSLAAYLRTGYVPQPRSIYRGIFKLPPGTIARVDAAGEEVTITPYWRATEAIGMGAREPFAGTPSEAADLLEQLLGDAIEKQMLADVPLGAFLSGGVDSSTIVALMQRRSSRPVKTFTIGFHEARFNEAEHAKAVARHLGTDHTELYVTAAEARDVIADLPAIYSEPFADSSQIPTFLVAGLARRSVTVSLSGDAGDELFAGYSRYDITNRLWRRLRAVPRPVRSAAAKLLTTLSPTQWQRIADTAQRLAPPLRRLSNVGSKIHKGANVMASRSGDQLYHGLTSYWLDPAAVVPDAVRQEGALYAELDLPAGLNEVERMMAIDLVTYLPDDILAKVDRAAMAVSLETRVPLLDHRIVEFAWSLPLDVKFHEGVSKWPLREVLYRHVPRALIERPKTGFGVPIAEWLRGPLRDWAEDLLQPARLEADGLLRAAPVRESWRRHLSGRADHQYELWSILMFQAWREQQTAAPVACAA